MHPCIHCCIIYSCQDMEVNCLYTDGRMSKYDEVYIHNGILFCHKESPEILPFGTWISLENAGFAKQFIWISVVT